MFTALQKRGRDRLFILAEIIETALDGAVKTNIMYKANLSFAQLNEYIKVLLDLRCLEIIENDGRTIYKTTPKGLVFLQSYREIQDLLRKAQVSGSRGSLEMPKKEEKRNASFQFAGGSIKEIRSDIEDLKKRVLELESFTDRKQCPHCGNRTFPDFRFCPYCGYPLQITTGISKKVATR